MRYDISAKRLARISLALFLACFAARITLMAMRYREFDLPLRGAEAALVTFSAYEFGRAAGYRARARKIRAR